MTPNPIIKEIEKLMRELIDKGPKAGLVSGEWSRILDSIQFCSLIAFTVSTGRYTDEELNVFLENVRPHHKFIMDTVNKKRRAHPERSRRKFL